MQINVRNYNGVKRFQEGGAMTPEDQAVATPQEAAPVEEAPMEEAPAQGGGDPIMQLAEMAMQALQNQDCEAAMAVCQGFIQLLQEAQGGAQAAPQGEPVYRAGGKLVTRI